MQLRLAVLPLGLNRNSSPYTENMVPLGKYLLLITHNFVPNMGDLLSITTGTKSMPICVVLLRIKISRALTDCVSLYPKASFKVPCNSAEIVVITMRQYLPFLVKTCCNIISDLQSLHWLKLLGTLSFEERVCTLSNVLQTNLL